MNDQHIASAFDRDLEAIQAQIMKMGGLVDNAILEAVIKVSANLERIGDYAKNLAKRTSVLSQMAPVNDSAGALRRMAKEVERMLKDALDAYVSRDAELAQDVIDRDFEVDQMYNALFREFLNYIMEDQRNITE